MEIDATVKNICKEIKEGIHMFGEYTYFDKGADEVVDVNRWVDEFRQLCMEGKPEEVGEILIKVMEQDEKYGMLFVQCVVDSLDTLPDDKWDRLIEYDDRIAQAY